MMQPSKGAKDVSVVSVDGDQGLEGDLAAPDRLWKEDVNRMGIGIRLLFMNDLNGAESVFRRGMKTSQRLAVNKDPNDLSKIRDLQGVFALQHALVSIMKGLASLASDRLDECLCRLRHAEEITARGADWIGQKVVRGLVFLLQGFILCLKHSFVKGVFSFIRSSMWIRKFEDEALDMGKEQEVVRSCALLALGGFYLLLDMLPPSLLKAATFLSGLNYDRKSSLRMLMTCWKEGGVFSSWGALIWLLYHLDTKSFLNQRLTNAEMEDCVAILKWARATYPNSVFFSGAEAEFEACRLNVQVAMQIIDRAMPFAKDLRAIEWAFNYKRGVYELVDFNLEQAVFYFSCSLQASFRAGRHIMVPFIAMYALLCYNVLSEYCSELELHIDEMQFSAEKNAGEDEYIESRALSKPAALLMNRLSDGMDSTKAAAQADEMIAVLSKYRDMDRMDWGRQDLYAFSIFDRYHAWFHTQTADDQDLESRDPARNEQQIDINQKPWPLLELIDCMILRIRCHKWMNEAQVAHLYEMLQAAVEDRTPCAEDEIRICTCLSQLLLDHGELDQALTWCDAGLELESKVKNMDYVITLLYLKSLAMYKREQLLSVQYCLSLIDSKSQKLKNVPAVAFKANTLRKELDNSSLNVQNEYTTIDIDAGKTHRQTIDLIAGQRVAWDWMIQSYDIQFTALFRPRDPSASGKMVTSIEQYSAVNGPCMGSFQSSLDGDILFEWDNRYSFFRAKTLVYRIRIGTEES